MTAGADQRPWLELGSETSSQDSRSTRLIRWSAMRAITSASQASGSMSSSESQRVSPRTFVTAEDIPIVSGKTPNSRSMAWIIVPSTGSGSGS
jgi:hypothetical protein